MDSTSITPANPSSPIDRISLEEGTTENNALDFVLPVSDQRPSVRL
jgi:hypothetical protein